MWTPQPGPCALPGILHPGVPLPDLGWCGAGSWWAWAPMCGGLWGAPEAVHIARGWQQHTEHGRAPSGCAGRDPQTPARLTSLTSCPFQDPQSAIEEGCDPSGGGQPARAGLFSGEGPMWQPRLCSGVPPRSPVQFMLGALAQLYPLLGRPQGHCRVTQRAHPGLTSPGCPCLSLLRPGMLGAARQAARAVLTSWQGHPPGMLLPEVAASPPHRLSLCPYGTKAHLDPDPEHRRACPHVGVMGAQPPVGPAGGGQGGKFPSAPRCHRAGVTAGAWHSPKTLGGWLCGMATVPSPLLDPTPRWPGQAELAGGSWP